MRGCLLFFALTLFFAIPGKCQVNLANGLVAHFPFDGNTNDVSGNNHHGQLVNGTQLTTDRFGNANNAFLFDGVNDYIRVPDNGSFSTPTFSLVLWFQSNSDDLQNLVGKRDFTTVGGTAGAQYQFFINYPPFPGIGSNLVGNNSTCSNISSSSYINTNDWICRTKWYCVVISFDGSSHKIYIDGVLKKNEPTTFNGFLSCTSDLRFGNWWQGDLLPFKGKMDDIRWYNRALNQQEVTALYANFSNISGQCGSTAGAGFLTPDTVCVNMPVNITNTSVGATNYYWNFCVANSGTNPVGTNLGNFGFALPVFMDYAKDGNNYYAFVTNNMPGKLTRLAFGNSLLNPPISFDMGNLGGVIPDFCEGIQLVKNEGRWYILIVGGKPTGRIVKIDLGTSLSNNSPVATNWGNIGNLAYPTDLHVFQDGANWYGLTINAITSGITRFNFTSSFNNTPTATDLGNIGSLDYPTGIYAINNGGNWHAFVSNAGGAGAPNSLTSSLSRLDFGNSLLNVPTGVNLGNPNNTFRSARDLTIYKSCNEIFGFAVNNSNNSDIVRLNFNNSLTAVPTAISLGNTGNLSFPHSISKLFRVENDLYSFITNVNNNTLTRLKFEGCGSSSLAASTLQNPPPVVYNAPGTYNISLTIDDGLPTQASFCKPVVVVQMLSSPTQYKGICPADSVLLTSRIASGNLWSNGSTGNSIYVKTAGKYWVRSSSGGCISIDSFEVSMKASPVTNLGIDTAICESDSLMLDAGNAGAGYLWQDGQTTQQYIVKKDGLYYVTVNLNGCVGKDSISVTHLEGPALSLSDDTTICRTGLATLVANGIGVFNWSPSQGLSGLVSSVVTAAPDTTTKYFVAITNSDNCTAKDSVTVTVIAKPVFSVVSSKPVLCRGDSVLLSAAGGDFYAWSPLGYISRPASNTTLAYPLSSTTYKVIIDHIGCRIKDSLFVGLPVVEKSFVSVHKSNDINCFLGQAHLRVDGGSRFLWRPASGLSDSTSNSPVVTITSSATYNVLITTPEGCEVSDSITVFVEKGAEGTGFPVPSAFTPNSDGKNDCFGVNYWGDVKDFSMNLYNRWGELLFKADHPSQCWNGFYKGQLQPGDVYVYWIKAKTHCGDVLRKGSFILIR